MGIPAQLHTDGAKELTQGEFKKWANEVVIMQTLAEPHSPWQNWAEKVIGKIKKCVRNLMTKAHCPLQF